MNRKKTILYFYLVCSTLGTLLFILFDLVLPNWSRIKAKEETVMYHPLLDSLARQALITKDVPVSACLLYKDKIIGVGYNTVYAEYNLCGHAEINSLNNAVKTLGLDQFMKLDKSAIKLITTFEPCMMCRGAALEYGITHIVSILPKSNRDRWTQYKQLWRYYSQHTLAKEPRFQYNLFKMHPQFDSLAYPFP